VGVYYFRLLILSHKSEGSPGREIRSKSKSKSKSKSNERTERISPRATLDGSPEDIILQTIPFLKYSEIQELCNTNDNFKEMCKKPIVKKVISDTKKREDELRRLEKENARLRRMRQEAKDKEEEVLLRMIDDMSIDYTDIRRLCNSSISFHQKCFKHKDKILRRRQMENG